MNEFKKKYPRTHKAMKYVGGAVDIATKAYGIAKTVAALVNSEAKCYYIAPTSSTISTTPTIYSLVTPSQGTGVTEREGNSIALKAICLKDTITWNTAGVSSQSIRRMVILDRNQGSGAWSTPSDVLASVSMIGLRNQLFKKRFKILRDDVYHYDNSVARYTPPTLYLKKQFYFKSKNGKAPQRLHLEFSGASAYGKNMIYVMYFSTVAANMPTVEVTWQATYYDN